MQVETALEKLLQQTHVKAKAKADFMMARRDQELECRRLRDLLAGLREERASAQEEEARVALIAEESARARQEGRKMVDAEKRKRQKVQIEAHKAKKQQIEEQNRFILVRELKYKVRIYLRYPLPYFLKLSVKTCAVQ